MKTFCIADVLSLRVLKDIFSHMYCMFDRSHHRLRNIQRLGDQYTGLACL